MPLQIVSVHIIRRLLNALHFHRSIGQPYYDVAESRLRSEHYFITVIDFI